LQPDESLAVMMADSRGHADTWGTIARTYIRLAGDRSLPVAMQDRLIAEADALTPDNLYDVFTLATSHTDSCSSRRRWPASSTNWPLSTPRGFARGPGMAVRAYPEPLPQPLAAGARAWVADTQKR
jgi:hypothetical protein